MSKNCAICRENIKEDNGKLKGTIVRVKDEENKSQFIHVCSGCQKQNKWIERAKIKSA